MIYAFHLLSIKKTQEKIDYSEKIVRVEKWRTRVFWLSVCSFFIYMFIIWSFSRIGFKTSDLPFPFNLVSSFFMGWVLFFLMTSMVVSISSFVTYYKMARLCLQVTIDALGRLLTREEFSAEYVHRCFKWLKLGFQNCNSMLMDNPYFVVIKNIDQYRQYVLSVALVGNKYDLKTVLVALQRMLESFGNRKENFNLQNFLTALLFLRGETSRMSESTEVLAEMILIKPSLWERTREALKSPYTMLGITIISVAIAVLTLILTMRVQFF
jgi:hypothetical protein